MLQPKVYSKKDKKVLEVVENDFDYKVIVVRDIDNTVGTLNFLMLNSWITRGSKIRTGPIFIRVISWNMCEDIQMLERLEV